MEQTDKRDEDSIDFSELAKKGKDFFKSLGNKAKKTEESESKESDNYSLEFKKVSTYCKKNSSWLIPLVLIIIAISFSTYFRAMPATLPITDGWAENNVNNFYRNQIADDINQQYPNLPELNRNALIDKELAKVLSENADLVKSQNEQLSQQMKGQFQDENGHTYLLAIDPYLWYSQTRNVVKHGHLGDQKIEGESYFSLRDGRLPKKSSTQLHPYLSAYLYKFLSLFSKDMTIMRALFWMPLILIGLALIPVFFIGRRIGGNIGGFFAALFLGINGSLLGRTPAGFSDTDPYSIVLPLFVAWLFLESYTAKTQKSRILLSTGAGFFVGLYAFAWTGWSPVFLFVIAALLASIIISVLKAWTQERSFKKVEWQSLNKKIKQKSLLLLAFFISSGVFVSLFKGFSSFQVGFMRPIQFITLKEVGIKSIWPNVLTTVAEFNTASFSNVISQIGSNIFFWLGLMGLVVMTLRKKLNGMNWAYLGLAGIYYLIIVSSAEKLNDPIIFLGLVAIPPIVGIIKIIFLKEKRDPTFLIFLALWLLATAYAFSKGMRFAILLIPPFSIALGASLGYIFNQVSKSMSKVIKLNKNISKLLMFVIIALLFLTPLSTADRIALNEVPSMNDGWYNTLTKIKNDATDSIITSWWDFGHWFVAISERRVTFDGGDQGERIHWVGRTLRTSDETEAVGILRMLNCVQEKAPHVLEKFTGDDLEAVNILYDVFQTDSRKEATATYKKAGLTNEQIVTMLDQTHCKDLLPNYYITSGDMVGKAGVWGHFGSWDFTKATMFQSTKNLGTEQAINLLTSNFGMTREEAMKTHVEIQTNKGDQWIAPWPGYYTQPRQCQKVESDFILCVGSLQQGNFGIKVNLNTFDAVIDGQNELVPNSIIYPTKDGVVTKKLEGKKAGFSIVLIPNGENYNFFVADPLQAGSMFTRLFYLQGHGLSCFSKFDDVQASGVGKIITWKVDYSCQQNNNIFFS